MPLPPALKPTAASAFIGLASLMLASCAVVPPGDRLLSSAPLRQTGPIGDADSHSSQSGTPSAVDSSAPGSLRVLSWNIHKERDAGWQRDLAHYAKESDLLLLQEAKLDAPMRDLLDKEGCSWQMVDAFAVRGQERGVLIAARAAPVDALPLRAREPLSTLPKSALVTRFQLAGRSEQLAVADLHGINFTLGVRRFRSQLDAVAQELGHHEGPVIFAGDFNTWNPRRQKVLGKTVTDLGLTPVNFDPDDRRRAFGRHLDHLFVRGFSVLDATSAKVTSSDHNPIMARLVTHETEKG